jgi:flagellar biosynthetic protein FliO
MTGSLCKSAVLTVGFSLLLAGGLSAEQVSPILDTHRSLQIPPQDILKVCTEPKASAGEAVEPVAVPSSRPAARVADAAPAGRASVRNDTATRPAGLFPESGDRESRQIARTSNAERPASVPLRPSEAKDVGRSRRNTASWSATDVWPLLSVLALILVLAWIVKRALPGRRVFAGSGVMEVLSRTPLSNKQSLVLVRMGRRLLLLGVTGDEMHTLCLVEDPDQVAMLVGEAASGRPGSMTQAFARTLVEEHRAYEDDAVEEAEQSSETGGQVRSLLDKVRHLASRRNVA